MTHKNLSRVQALCRRYVAPPLSKNGFKNQGLLWNRTRRNLVDVVEIQTSKGSGPDQESFTLNAGIFFPDFYKTIWGKSPGAFAQPPDCTVLFRLPHLLQETFPESFHDRWWELKGDSDIDNVGRQVQSAIEGKLLPFFAAQSTLEALEDLLERMGGGRRTYPLTQINLALLKRETGDREGAESILRGLISPDDDPWSDRAREVLSRLQ